MNIHGITTTSGFAANFVINLVMEHSEFVKYVDTVQNNKMVGIEKIYNPITKEVAVENYRSPENNYVLADKIKLINELDTVAEHSASITEYLDNFYPGTTYGSDSNIIVYLGPNESLYTVSDYLNEYKNLGIKLVIVGATRRLHIGEIIAKRSTLPYVTTDVEVTEYEDNLKKIISDAKAAGIEWSFVDTGRLVIDGDESAYTEMCAALGIQPNLALFNEKLAWYKANVWNV